MSFIAEFGITSPIMEESAAVVPEMVFRTEELHLGEEPKFVFWASGDDFGRFESALVTDHTVDEYTLLTELGDRRLYRVTLTEAGREAMTYPTATEYDIVFLEVTATHEGSQVRARVPSREALKIYREACVERGISFDIDRLYHEEPDDSADQYGLTRPQRDVLVRAHEQGYFNDPRSITLEELADEFDITPSALGRRMRRAQDELIGHTVRADS